MLPLTSSAINLCSITEVLLSSLTNKDIWCLSFMTIARFFGEMSKQQLSGAKRVTEDLRG